jgi:hypothetical protein
MQGAREGGGKIDREIWKENATSGIIWYLTTGKWWGAVEGQSACEEAGAEVLHKRARSFVRSVVAKDGCSTYQRRSGSVERRIVPQISMSIR